MHPSSLFTASSRSVSGTHLSIILSCCWRCRMEKEDRGDRLSYSGKWILKQLSKHCQQCSCIWEKDLPVWLCVLSKVTDWMLWFLSWISALAPHYPWWCPAVRKFLHFHYFFLSFGMHKLGLLLDEQASDFPRCTSCRLLWDSWNMLFRFETMTLQRFAFMTQAGPLT